MLARFASLFKPKDKFSLEMLRYYNQVLTRNTVITDKNRDLVVETLRCLAEVLIWGDQNNPEFFEYVRSVARRAACRRLTQARGNLRCSFFLEKGMLSYFPNILRQKTAQVVKVQLLQTLSILIENIQSQHAICA